MFISFAGVDHCLAESFSSISASENFFHKCSIFSSFSLVCLSEVTYRVISALSAPYLAFPFYSSDISVSFPWDGGSLFSTD